MSTIFERYEQPKEVTADAVTAWHGILSSLIGDLNTESVSTADYESKIRKGWETQEASVELKQVFAEFTSSLFNLIDSSPVDATQAYEMLRTLSSSVKDERDYHVKHEARLSKPKASVGDEFTAKKSDAVAVKEHIENLFNLSTMGMFEWPDSVKVKTLTDGSVKPDLPRIPSGPREGGGRKAATAHLRLTVDDVFYGENTVAQVCHDVLSSGAHRIGETDLIGFVEKSGHSISKGWDEPVPIMGHLVLGTIVTATSDEEENEEEQ